MNQFRLIDDKTYRATKMTPEEAQAVIEMWGLQHRLADDGMTSIEDVAEGLTISPEQVKHYLRQVRAQKTKRPPRSIRSDLKLAFAAIGALVIIFSTVAGVVNTIVNGRRDLYQQSRFYMGAGGMQVTNYSFYLPPDWEKRHTINPVHYAFAVGNEVYEAPFQKPIKPVAAEIKKALEACVGGALASDSVVGTKPISKESIAKALESDPTDSRYTSSGYVDQNGLYRESRTADDENLVVWQKVQIAFGGKHTEGYMPYARVSDPSLKEAVLAAQAKKIEGFVEAGLDLAKTKRS